MSFCWGKKPDWEKTGESSAVSKAKSGVIGDGVCMLVESDEFVRTSWGVDGEPMGDES